MSSANASMGVISGGGLLRLSSAVVDRSGLQSVFFVVVSSFVVGLSVVGGSIG